MELNKSNIKKILGVVAFAALFYTGLQQWDRVCAFAAKIFGYLFPFLLGGGIAFILHVPMRFLEGRVVEPLLRRGPDRLRRSSRGVSIVLALALVAGVLFFVVFLVAPALDETAQSVAEKAPAAFRSLRRWVYSLQDKYPEIAKEILSIDIDWRSVGEQVGGWISAAGAQALSSTVGMAASVIGVFVKFFIALTFALYVLSQKEKLGRQCRMLFYAFLPEKGADWLLRVGGMASQTFARFLSGQCMEACILGAMFFVAMTIFQFKYALMISVLIAVTALIPIFGAMIALVVGDFLLLIDDPTQAFWFIILFFALQQLEENLIYPRVVGNSVGLPSIWVLAAVSIGGSAMGIPGMLLFIPLCSVLYALLREVTYTRLGRRYGAKAAVLTAGGAPAPSKPKAGKKPASKPPAAHNNRKGGEGGDRP